MRRQKAEDALESQREFSRRIKGGRFAPLYLLEGAEEMLRTRALEELIAAAVDPSVRDFNVSRVSAAGGSLNDALAFAAQLPMISERRVVIVTDFETISDEQQLERLKDYLRRPVESTVLVFVSPGLDKRRTIAVMLGKTCEVVRFDPLDERDGAPRWVADYVSRQGAMMDRAAAAYLVGTVGTDLRRLSNEADKLVSYIGGRGRITRTEIEEAVRHSREHSNFELTDAVLDGDRRRALVVLDRIFANPSENPGTLAIMILGAIGATYRKMLASKELMRQNAPNDEVARAVGMSPFLVTKLNERVRRVEMERIVRGMARIADADIALKSSLGTPRLQLELLVIELCPESAV